MLQPRPPICIHVAGLFMDTSRHLTIRFRLIESTSWPRPAVCVHVAGLFMATSPHHHLFLCFSWRQRHSNFELLCLLKSLKFWIKFSLRKYENSSLFDRIVVYLSRVCSSNLEVPHQCGSLLLSSIPSFFPYASRSSLSVQFYYNM